MSPIKIFIGYVFTLLSSCTKKKSDSISCWMRSNRLQLNATQTLGLGAVSSVRLSVPMETRLDAEAVENETLNTSKGGEWRE